MFYFEGQYANEIVDNLHKKLEKEGKNIDNYFYDKEKYSTAFILALSSKNTEYLKALKLLNFEKYGTNFIIPKEIFNNIIMKDNRIEYFTLINELGLFNNNYTKSHQDVFSYLIDNDKSELIDDLLEADVQPLFSGQRNYLLTMIKNKDIVNLKKYMEKDFYVNIEDIKDIFIEVDISSKKDVDVLTEMLQLISNNSYLDKKEENFLASKLFTNMLKKMDLETLKLFNKTYPINDFNMIQNYSYFKNNSEICNSLSKNDCEILMFLKEISSMKYILSILTNEIFLSALNNNIEKNKYSIIGTETELKNFINKKVHDLLPKLIMDDKLKSIDVMLDVYNQSKNVISTTNDLNIKYEDTEFSNLINDNIANIVEKTWLKIDNEYSNILNKYILDKKYLNKDSNIINQMYLVKGDDNKKIPPDIINLSVLAVHLNNNEMAKKIVNHPGFILSEQMVSLSLHKQTDDTVDSVLNNFVLYENELKINKEEMQQLLKEIKNIPERDFVKRSKYSAHYIQTLVEKRQLNNIMANNHLINKAKNRL